MQLFDDQIGAINKLKQSLRAGYKRIVLYSPTGSGKSVIAAHMIESALNKNKRAAFLVNRKQLAHQFADRLYSMGIKPGVAQGENTHNLHRDVIVGTVQTVANRGMSDIDLAIIDEAHYTPGSKVYREFIFQHRHIPIIGLTATPFSKGMSGRHPELDNESLFEHMDIASTIGDLIANGRLVDCDIFAPDEPDMEGVMVQRNIFGEQEYNERQAGERVNKIELIGNIVKCWMSLASGRKTVVFAHNIAHSKNIVEAFRKQGISAEHVDGYTEDEERRHIFDRFKSGETQIICNVAVMREGVDIPDTSCMILAKPTKSLITWVQMVGRILRVSPGKDKGLVLDHSGSAWRLGYPTQDLPLELDDGQKKPESKQREKKDKEEVKCSVCSMIKRSLKCDNCGHEPVIPDNVDYKKGELKLIEKKQTKTQQLSQDKALLYAELKQVALDRKWTDKKLAGQFKNITGVWPSGSVLNVGPVPPRDETLSMLKHHQIRASKSRRHYA